MYISNSYRNSINKKIAKPAAVLTLLIAIMVWAGLVDYASGKAHTPSAPAVTFNTVLCFILSAAALFFLDQKKLRWYKRIIAVSCALIVLLIAGLTLGEHILKFNAGIDQLFWKVPDTQTSYPGRMTAVTAALLLLLAFVHLLLYNRRFHLLVQIILIAGFTVLTLVFLVNLSLIKFHKWSLLHPSTMHTCLAFMALYAGTFFSYPLSYLHFSFEKRMVANFSFAILLLIIVILSFRNAGRSFEKTSKWVEHTHNVLLKAGEINTGAAEMQNRLRGYLITGNEGYLSSFTDAATATTRYVHELKKLTKDNPVQQQKADSLLQMVNWYIQSRKEVISLYQNPVVNAAKMKAEINEGEDITNDIQSIISSIQQQENQLLVKRKAVNDRNMSNSSRAIALLQIVIGFLMIAAFILVFINIQKRKRAEMQLRQVNSELEERVAEKAKEVTEREKQYRFLIENMQEGIQVIGFDWRYQFVNKAYLQHRGNAGDPLIGYTLMEKNPGIEKTEVFQVLQRCMKERLPARFEYNNAQGFFELSIEPVPEGLFILSMDVTERKTYLEELKRSRAQLAEAQKIARLARWEWNAEKGMINPAPEMLELLGWAPHTPFTTADFMNLIHPEDSQLFKKQLQVALENGTPLNAEFRIYGTGKQIKYLHIVSEICFNQEHQALGFVGTIQDVSELKKSEAMLKQLNANLEKRASELKASNAELERFAFVASHDLQEPLRMISSFLSLLETEAKDQLDDAGKEYIHYAVDGAERMKKLIQALLEYSRIDVKKEGVTPVDCNQVVNDVQELLETTIREKKAVIEVQPLPVIGAVETQIQQLFQNLIGNALKYNNKYEPRVEVGCTEEPGQWKFYVKDNGIGIDPKYFEKIFIIFQRLHDKSQYAGTGIGLAICKKIVEKHGGTIWVESEPQHGSTFYFTIPKNIA